MIFWKPTDVTIRYKITKLLEIPPYDSIKKIHVMRFGKTNLLYDQIKKNKDERNSYKYVFMNWLKDIRKYKCT